MTRKNSNRTISEIKVMMAEDGDFLRPIVRTVIEEFLAAQQTAQSSQPGHLSAGAFCLSTRNGLLQLPGGRDPFAAPLSQQRSRARSGGWR